MPWRKTRRSISASTAARGDARFLLPGRRVDVPALVENAVALALYRRYETQGQQQGGFLDPEDLHVWSTAGGKEVDFVCGPRHELDAVEVKYQGEIDGRSVAGIRRAFRGRSAVIVTKDTLELSDDHALIPAHLLLWALGDGLLPSAP